MIGNTDDKLAKLAFGDLPEAEAERVRSRIARDPVKARRLAEFEAMRVELRRLNDVPPDQYSKERLREALLARALRPEPKPAFRPVFVTVPVLICAIAYGATMVARRSPQGTAPVAIIETHQPSSTAVALKSPEPSHPLVAANVPSSVVPKSFRTASLRRSVRTHSSPVVHESPSIPDPHELVANSTVNHAPMATLASNKTEHNSAHPTESDPDSVPAIVLIDPPKETEPGSQRATEVSNSRNVLIGG